ncbi:MAG: hypothetical protein V4454_01220 [Pseudomonadota bacterium]
MEKNIENTEADELIRNLARIQRARNVLGTMTDRVLGWGEAIPVSDPKFTGTDEARLERLRGTLNRNAKADIAQPGQAMAQVVEAMYGHIVSDVASASAALMSLRSTSSQPTSDVKSIDAIDVEVRVVTDD